ncbi:MAG: band 7 protein [Planctomyces sp.]|nr:band 7 protein [Planctomyces sp.]
MNEVRPNRLPIGPLVVAILILGLGLGGWRWMIDRVWVPEGQSLMLRYKGPLVFGKRVNAVGRFAKVVDGVQEIGVIEEMPGPGRHFYSPIWWERTLVPNVAIETGEVGLVTSKLGDRLPAGQLLVDGTIGEAAHKGNLRRVLIPGKYRVNPFGYAVEVVKTHVSNDYNQAKSSGWVDIPTGAIGVVTNLVDDPAFNIRAGIQQAVLQPGIYVLNPKARQIDVMYVGYYEKSIVTNLLTASDGHLKLDASGEPMAAHDGSGISFPSADGFNIQMDFTTVWGVMPDQAVEIVRNFGNLAAVETKIIVPQIESICRNQGSQFGAPDLLAGDTREKFQQQITEAFQSAMKAKNISLLNGLVRYIYIPAKVREPIQLANLANELKLTSDQKELTAKTEGELREAEKQVDLAVETVKVETEKKVAKVKADGEKKAAETRAETAKLLAKIDRETALLDQQATVVLGEAEAKSQKMLEESKASKFQLAVDAFGGGTAYNQWVFANGLPSDIELRFLYAGEGTFWTDLKGFTETMLGRQMQAGQTSSSVPPGGPAGTQR